MFEIYHRLNGRDAANDYSLFQRRAIAWGDSVAARVNPIISAEVVWLCPQSQGIRSGKTRCKEGSYLEYQFKQHGLCRSCGPEGRFKKNHISTIAPFAADACIAETTRCTS